MSLVIAFALGCIIGGTGMYVANRLSTRALCDMNAMLSSALHPAAPVPASVDRDERAAAVESGEVIDHTAVRAERLSTIRNNLEQLAMRTGTPLTDEALDAEAMRLAGADIHRGA